MVIHTSQFNFVLPQDSHNDIAPLFVIFIIFSRVNKRWNRILSCTHAWTHIDFWQEQKTDKNWDTKDNEDTRRRYLGVEANTWVFPVDEKAVFDFLTKYTARSLKSIYLHVASTKIMMHLKERCGNLETISFLSPKGPSKSAISQSGLKPYVATGIDQRQRHLSFRFYNHECIIPVSQSIKILEFPLELFCFDCKHQQANFLTCLRKCTNLQHLTITGVNAQYLSSDSLDVLSQDLTEVNFLKLSTETKYSNQLCNALLPLLKFAEMRVFRMSIEHPWNATYNAIIDEFLSGIADKWQDLRILALVGIRPPPDGIVRSVMTSLTQLRELDLYGVMVTDESVRLIAENLQMLTYLKLVNGIYTSSGIKALCGHPSIERLYLLQENQSRPAPEWVLAVYDVILSLPKITYVKLVGFRVVAIHAKEEIPAVSPTIKIEVENLDESSHHYDPVRPAFD